MHARLQRRTRFQITTGPGGSRRGEKGSRGALGGVGWRISFTKRDTRNMSGDPEAGLLEDSGAVEHVARAQRGPERGADDLDLLLRVRAARAVHHREQVVGPVGQSARTPV